MKHRRNRKMWDAIFKGFTLPESLVVLMIIGFFTFLPLLSFHRWQQSVEVQLFFDSFEKMVQTAQHMAISQHRVVQVTIKEREVGYFMYDGGTVQRSIEIPKQLEATTTSRVLVFPGISGNYSGLDKVTFQWAERSQVTEYQFQMGSGRFERKDY